MLAVEGTDTEEVAELIMLSAELAGSHEASEAAHTSYRSLDPPMVLFQSIIIGITLVTPPAKHFAAETHPSSSRAGKSWVRRSRGSVAR